MPCRLPATDTDWQGVPPLNTSRSYFDPSTFVMSPRFGTCGYRHARTLHGNFSISEKNLAFHAQSLTACECASTPLHVVAYCTDRSFETYPSSRRTRSTRKLTHSAQFTPHEFPHAL